MAVKVTLVPAQIVLSTSLAVMLTLAGRFGFTVAVTASLEVDVHPDVVFLDSA